MLKVAGGGGGAAGAVKYKGTWDASTNTPTLVSSVGSQGDYYVVSVSGNTDLNGITDWVAGDWAIFNGTVWEKVDNSESVISVNGQTGVVTLNYADVGAPSTSGTNATGTWPVSITGSAASAANLNVNIEVANVSLFPVLVSGSGITPAKIDGGNNFRYNPSTDTLTIPTVSATNVSATTFTGNLTGTASLATIATNIAGGATGSLPYQSSANTTALLSVGSDGTVLRVSSGVPTWGTDYVGTVTSVDTGTGLTGGPITDSGTISLANTAVTAGTYGSGSLIPQITIDAQGRITSASNVSATGASTVITAITTITAGDVIPWENNSSVVIPWQNEVPENINWLNNVYSITSNNATILVDCTTEPLGTLLPAASGVTGQQFKIKKIDSSNNAVTVSTTSSQTIDGSTTYSLPDQYDSVTLQSDGSEWWITAKVA